MASFSNKKSLVIILLTIVFAMFIGNVTGKEKEIFGISFYSIYDLFGRLFIHALTLVVIPLVSSSIITGIAKIGRKSKFGKLGLKTLLFFLSTSFIAILIGAIFINILKPGAAFIGKISHLPQIQISLTEKPDFFGNFIFDLVPSNIFKAFTEGNMLGVIFFSFLFGYALVHISKEASSMHLTFWQGVFEAMIYITKIIMRFMPFGVFCLVAKAFAETGLDSLQSLGLFFMSVLLGLGVFGCIVLPLLLKFIGGVNPFLYFRSIAPALVAGFSTSSTSAALSTSIDCMEKMGISNRISSLVISLGATVNLSGSALYEIMAALFVAQAFGLELSFLTQLAFIFITLILSMGIAGIPSASLVVIVTLLRILHLPIEGIGLFIAVDRLLDMCRTSVNVLSGSCCAVLVEKAAAKEKNYGLNQ